MSLAYETNPDLAGARAGVRAVDENVASANSGWRPTVNASVSYGIQHGEIQNYPTSFNTRPLTGQVAVTQHLFRGGQTFAEVGRAMAQVRSARAQLVDTERRVLFGAVAAYLDVVRDEKVVALNRQNVDALQKELDAARTQRGAGAVTRTDVDQAEARLSRAQSDVAAAERQLATSRSTFVNVIGQPAPTLDPSPVVPKLPASQAVAQEIGTRYSPRVIQAKADLRASEYAVADAVGAMLPQISVSGQYQYVQDGAGTNIFGTSKAQNIVSVVGQLTVPIYQGGAEDAAVRKAKALRSQSALAVHSAERSASKDVDDAWEAVRSARTQIRANQAQVDADKRALDGVTQEQQGGERSVLDILNAQQELLNAQVAMASAEHDNSWPPTELLWATGQLTARARRSMCAIIIRRRITMTSRVPGMVWASDAAAQCLATLSRLRKADFLWRNWSPWAAARSRDARSGAGRHHGEPHIAACRVRAQRHDEHPGADDFLLYVAGL